MFEAWSHQFVIASPKLIVTDRNLENPQWHCFLKTDQALKDWIYECTTKRNLTNHNYLVPKTKLITWLAANCTCVLEVIQRARIYSPSVKETICYWAFISGALDVSHPYNSFSFSKRRPWTGCYRSVESQLSANHCCALKVPPLVAYCSPEATEEYFNSTMEARISTRQSNCKR